MTKKFCDHDEIDSVLSAFQNWRQNLYFGLKMSFNNNLTYINVKQNVIVTLVTDGKMLM